MARRRLRMDLVATVLLAVFLVGCGLIYLYYPVIPHSALGWVALVIVGIPTWLFLEWLGDVVLGAKVFSRLSSAGRIALGIPVFAVLMILGGLVVWLGQRLIGGLR